MIAERWSAVRFSVASTWGTESPEQRINSKVSQTIHWSPITRYSATSAVQLTWTFRVPRPVAVLLFLPSLAWAWHDVRGLHQIVAPNLEGAEPASNSISRVTVRALERMPAAEWSVLGRPCYEDCFACRRGTSLHNASVTQPSFLAWTTRYASHFAPQISGAFCVRLTLVASPARPGPTYRSRRGTPLAAFDFDACAGGVTPWF